MNINFTERAVAFLDILGFKSLVSEAHRSDAGRKRLSKLMTRMASNEALNRVYKGGVPNVLRPISLEISDSIILSTPLAQADHPLYGGLEILVMRCAQIAAVLLEEGYILVDAHARLTIYDVLCSGTGDQRRRS